MFKKKSLTASSLGIRVIIGGYLLYLAYSLIPSIRTAVDTKEMIFWGAIVALFFGVGSLIMFFSIKALLKGDYDKGITSDELETEKDDSNLIEEDVTEEEDK